MPWVPDSCSAAMAYNVRVWLLLAMLGRRGAIPAVCCKLEPNLRDWGICVYQGDDGLSSQWARGCLWEDMNVSI